jgi:dolichyl-phosphate beta-glucosyltransferase
MISDEATESPTSRPRDQQGISQWIEQQPASPKEVVISIIVPALNEERRLPSTLIDIVDFFDSRNLPYEVIVVDDGSTDGTSSMVRKFERVRANVRLIALPRNQGKGHAVRLGVLNAVGTRILFADADGATPIEEIVRLEAELERGSQIAIGSRALASQDTQVATSVHRKVLGRLFNAVVNCVLLPDIADTQCGFKLFTREAAQFVFRQQRSDRFAFDVELLFIARQVGLRIGEVPINWTNIPGSKVRLILDAVKMFRDVFRFRFYHRNLGPSDFQSFVAQLSAEPATDPT